MPLETEDARRRVSMTDLVFRIVTAAQDQAVGQTARAFLIIFAPRAMGDAVRIVYSMGPG